MRMNLDCSELKFDPFPEILYINLISVFNYKINKHDYIIIK